jgi:CspA family cold shock protein
MAAGTVKWFSVARKYGFIVPDDGGNDVFVHMSTLVAANIPELDDGAKVTFDLDETTPRRNALNLALASAEPVAESPVEPPAEPVAETPVEPLAESAVS